MAAANGCQAYALSESICSSRSNVLSSSAYTYQKQFQFRLCGSVRVDQGGAGSRSVQSLVRPDMEDMASPVEAIESVEGRPVRPRTVHAAPPEEAAESVEGHSPEGTSCPESDRFSCFSISPRLHRYKRRFGPASQTRPSGDMCSEIALPSSP